MKRKQKLVIHLQWRISCIKKQLQKVETTGPPRLLSSLRHELNVTQEILRIVKEYNYESQENANT